MGAWDEFVVRDGRKLYLCDCKVCGAEFYHSNPYRIVCPDKDRHKPILEQEEIKRRWSWSVEWDIQNLSHKERLEWDGKFAEMWEGRGNLSCEDDPADGGPRKGDLVRLRRPLRFPWTDSDQDRVWRVVGTCGKQAFCTPIDPGDGETVKVSRKSLRLVDEGTWTEECGEGET
jgi:hypothetical protein